MSDITIYTRQFCGFCTRAKSLLSAKGVKYNEIDVTHDVNQRARMMSRSNGRNTLPQIFVGKTHVGGCDDLYALEAKGGLDPLLANP
jgi:glutaredoxin 3